MCSDHGDSRNITRDDLKRAAEAAVIVHAIGGSYALCWQSLFLVRGTNMFNAVKNIGHSIQPG